MIGALGVLADVVLGEPPAAVHPVRGFGRLMAAVELRTYRDSRLAGAGYTTLGLAAGLASGLFIRGPVATYLAVAGRSLWDEARGVQRALDDDELETARRRLPALVGRDPTGLDEKEVARAAVGTSICKNRRGINPSLGLAPHPDPLLPQPV